MIGPLPASVPDIPGIDSDLLAGYTCILVMVDASSGWVEIIPLFEDSIEEVSYAFLAEWFC